MVSCPASGGEAGQLYSLPPPSIDEIARPISAYGAIDLPTYFLDLTPFVPLLTDGKAHIFTIDVASAEDNHEILQNWYVSGLLQVVTDSATRPTTGRITTYSAPPFARSTVSGSVSNGTVDFTLKATHSVHVEADVVSGGGKTTHVVWRQDLQYRNHQTYRDNATSQVTILQLSRVQLLI